MRSELIAHTCSRPCFAPSMTPAAARTCRCLVTPCRVIADNRSASIVIDAGPRSDRSWTSASRVGSPSAANNAAAPARRRLAILLGIVLQPDDHFAPALRVVRVDLRPAGETDRVEAR